MSDDRADDELLAADLQHGEDCGQQWDKLLPLHDEEIIEPAPKLLTQAQIIREIMVSNRLQTMIKNRIAELDRVLSAQLDLIMHNPDFQRLEASWRGLYFLVHEEDRTHDITNWESVKIRVFNASKADLMNDLERSAEFDQSRVFHKVCADVYGGEVERDPFGCLLGDYEFGRNPQDVLLLVRMSEIAAFIHAPFLAAVAPEMFGLATFADFGNCRNLERIFDGKEYKPWRNFRDSHDTRYVALALPRILLRCPYEIGDIEAFHYQEDVTGNDRGKYLWGNAAYALAARITASFAKHGWLAAIRGVEGGGLVQVLPTIHTFEADDGEVATRCPFEVRIDDQQEYELANLGFISLVHCKDTDYAAIFQTPSCQKSEQYRTDEQYAASREFASLHRLLCVSRFALYLTEMARDITPIFPNVERDECERFLNSWVNQYVLSGPIESASIEGRAARPLREGHISVSDDRSRPGCYLAFIFLNPHFQLDECAFGCARIWVLLPEGWPKPPAVVIPSPLFDQCQPESKELAQKGSEHLTLYGRKRWWQFWK